MKVGAYRAVQYRLEGRSETETTVMLHTTVETPTRFLQVMAWTIEQRFDREQSELERILDSVREEPAPSP